MPATLTPPRTGKDAEVGRQLEAAAGKIRIQDITIGGLILLATTLAYLAGMVLLDKSLDLDVWVRQVGFAGLLVVLGFLARKYIVTPLRTPVNPLYTAKIVEVSVEDSKNSLVNWVDLHDSSMPQSVRDAVTAKAAKHLANADVNKAVESRTLVWAGSAIAALVVVLAVLFLSFKPSVFLSLANRALNPFSSNVIATRTSITLLEPVGDLTIVAGEHVTIRVGVTGREPDSSAPDHMRALIRYNPADQNFEELALDRIGNGEWGMRVPMHLVQNGFWYRVAGGDAETAEFRVTVKPRPVFTNFEVKYEYPAYLNVAPETSRDPHVVAFRGTVVTIVAKANRELRDGRMVIADVTQPIIGSVAGDTLTVSFKLENNGSYRLFFTATNDETNIDSPPYLLRVMTDALPYVSFKPIQAEENKLPINGLLTVDGEATDDFGIDNMTLKMKVQNGPMLKAKPYRAGKSFRRESDNTWPLTLDYKDSIRVSDIKLETGGESKLKEGDIIEYWLEAADNCTEPKANIGRTKSYTVRLGPATSDEPPSVRNRGADEAKHQSTQDAKHTGESRPKPAGPQEKKKGEPEKVAPQPQVKDQYATDTSNKNQADPTAARNETNPTATEPKNGEKSPEPTKGTESKSNEGSNVAASSQPGDDETRKTAEKVKEDLDTIKNDPGSARGSDAPKPDEQTNPPAVSKTEKPSEGSSSKETNPIPNGKSEEASESKPQDSRATKAGEPQPKDPNEPSKSDESGNTGAKPSDDSGAQPRSQAAPKAGDGKPQPGGNPPESKEAVEPKAVENASGDKSNSAPKHQPEAKSTPGQQPMTGKEFENAGRELSSENPGKAEAARQKLEDHLGRDKAKDAESLFRDAQSPDLKKRAEAEKKIEEMKKDVDELAKKNKKPPEGSGGDAEKDQKTGGNSKPLDSKEITDAAKDLNSPDPARKKAAQEKLDKAFGQDARKAAEKLKEDLKSSDPATRKAAEDKLKDLAEAAKKEGEQLSKDLQSPDPGKRAAAQKKLDDLKKYAADKKPGDAGEKDAQGLADAAKDLNSSNASKKKAAQEKLDKAAGEKAKNDAGRMAEELKAGNREAKESLDKTAMEQAKKDAAKLADDLNSKDAATKAAAEKKLEDLKAKADAANAARDKELTDAAKNLNSPDPAKKKAAEDKIDEAIGPDARKAAQKLAEDLNSKDDATRAAAEKKLNNLKMQADEFAKNNDGHPQPTKEQMDALKNLAKDLKSDDRNRREDAEKKLDEMFGKDQRGKLQDQLKSDGKPNEPLPEDVAKKLEGMAKNGDPSKLPRPGPGGNGRDSAGTPLKVNEEHTRKGGDLKLEDLKNERYKKEIMKKNNMTIEEYDDFVARYEKLQKREAAAPTPPSVPKINTGTAGKVETRGTAASKTEGSGTVYAPPGYSDAQKAMLEKIRKAQEKK